MSYKQRTETSGVNCHSEQEQNQFKSTCMNRLQDDWGSPFCTVRAENCRDIFPEAQKVYDLMHLQNQPKNNDIDATCTKREGDWDKFCSNQDWQNNAYCVNLMNMCPVNNDVAKFIGQYEEKQKQQLLQSTGTRAGKLGTCDNNRTKIYKAECSTSQDSNKPYCRQYEDACRTCTPENNTLYKIHCPDFSNMWCGVYQTKCSNMMYPQITTPIDTTQTAPPTTPIDTTQTAPPSYIDPPSDYTIIPPSYIDTTPIDTTPSDYTPIDTTPIDTTQTPPTTTQTAPPTTTPMDTTQNPPTQTPPSYIDPPSDYTIIDTTPIDTTQTPPTTTQTPPTQNPPTTTPIDTTQTPPTTTQTPPTQNPPTTTQNPPTTTQNPPYIDTPSNYTPIDTTQTPPSQNPPTTTQNPPTTTQNPPSDTTDQTQQTQNPQTQNPPTTTPPTQNPPSDTTDQTPQTQNPPSDTTDQTPPTQNPPSDTTDQTEKKHSSSHCAFIPKNCVNIGFYVLGAAILFGILALFWVFVFINQSMHTSVRSSVTYSRVPQTSSDESSPAESQPTRQQQTSSSASNNFGPALPWQMRTGIFLNKWRKDRNQKMNQPKDEPGGGQKQEQTPSTSLAYPLQKDPEANNDEDDQRKRYKPRQRLLSKWRFTKKPLEKDESNKPLLKEESKYEIGDEEEDSIIISEDESPTPTPPTPPKGLLLPTTTTTTTPTTALNVPPDLLADESDSEDEDETLIASTTETRGGSASTTETRGASASPNFFTDKDEDDQKALIASTTETRGGSSLAGRKDSLEEMVDKE
jgi:hypothetical protein